MKSLLGVVCDVARLLWDIATTPFTMATVSSGGLVHGWKGARDLGANMLHHLSATNRMDYFRLYCITTGGPQACICTIRYTFPFESQSILVIKTSRITIIYFF